MKVSLFANPSYLSKEVPPGWPVSPKHWDRQTGLDSMEAAFWTYDRGEALGFDWIAVAEHHYAADLMAPTPMLLASAIAKRCPNVTIAVLGSVVPIGNPLRLAEEIAMLDLISGGRLVAGVFPGTANECLTYGTEPEEIRPRFREGIALIQRALTEPEPFWWEGRHFRFPVVSVWPRPVQEPLPPMLTSGTSPSSAEFAGRNGLKLGLSFAASPERCAELVEIYRQAAADVGREIAEDDILYRARIFVGGTDAEAERICIGYELGNVVNVFDPPPERARAWARIMGAATKGSSHKPPTSGMPEFWGDPESVTQQILEAQETIGFGVLDYIAGAYKLPYDLAMESVERFGSSVLPTLQAVTVR